jgi:hypothetical protein
MDGWQQYVSIRNRIRDWLRHRKFSTFLYLTDRMPDNSRVFRHLTIFRRWKGVRGKIIFFLHGDDKVQLIGLVTNRNISQYSNHHICAGIWQNSTPYPQDKNTGTLPFPNKWRGNIFVCRYLQIQMFLQFTALLRCPYPVIIFSLYSENCLRMHTKFCRGKERYLLQHI